MLRNMYHEKMDEWLFSFCWMMIFNLGITRSADIEQEMFSRDLGGC